MKLVPPPDPETRAAWDRADVIRDGIVAQYLDGDTRPWVVAYSGGKDSTLLVHLTFQALSRIRPGLRTRPVYVVCSDTRVETPAIVEHVYRSIAEMQSAARALSLPVSCHIVQPPLSDTFWVRIIGHGYPPPSRLFRWCTDRMKIKPNNSFVREHIHPDGEVLLLMGARSEESQTRAASLEKWRIAREFQTHRRLPRALVWAPLRDLTTEEVWHILVFQPPPWGGSHVFLRDLYKDAHAGECFLVTTEGTDPCGNSRFGCWTCTVVDRDRSLEGLILSGRGDYQELADLRDWLIEIRDGRHEYRMDRRKNGEEGIGPLKPEVRRALLERVVELDDRCDFRLITAEEISAIRLVWASEELDHAQLAVPALHTGTL
ncbi:MAG: DNA phosphorothioation system sulfurtransferase DndC [Solirubrobacteraceae bacterium]|jgi:DNA sulfur modification protein DndC